jgi:hypothetical protein
MADLRTADVGLRKAEINVKVNVKVNVKSGVGEKINGGLRRALC